MVSLSNHAGKTLSILFIHVKTRSLPPLPRWEGAPPPVIAISAAAHGEPVWQSRSRPIQNHPEPVEAPTHDISPLQRRNPSPYPLYQSGKSTAIQTHRRRIWGRTATIVSSKSQNGQRQTAGAYYFNVPVGPAHSGRHYAAWCESGRSGHHRIARNQGLNTCVPIRPYADTDLASFSKPTA